MLVVIADMELGFFYCIHEFAVSEGGSCFFVFLLYYFGFELLYSVFHVLFLLYSRIETLNYTKGTVFI